MAFGDVPTLMPCVWLFGVFLSLSLSIAGRRNESTFLSQFECDSRKRVSRQVSVSFRQKKKKPRAFFVESLFGPDARRSYREESIEEKAQRLIPAPTEVQVL